MELDEIIALVKERLAIAVKAISDLSTSENDMKAAQAVENLSRALSYLYQIKKTEG